MRAFRVRASVAAGAAIALAAASGCARTWPDAHAPGGCDAARVTIAGACVTPDEADAYCGPAARFSAGRCTSRLCPTGAPLDVATGTCTGARAVREAALRDGIELADDETLACHDGTTLVLDAGHALCLGGDVACPRGTEDRDGACEARPPCPPGTLAKGGRCVSLGVGESGVVDLVAWADGVLAAADGTGRDEVCRPLAQMPRSLGVGAGSRTVVLLDVELVIPNNDLTQLAARLDAREEATSHALPPAAARRADEAVQSLAAALRALGGTVGGTASLASLHVGIRCRIAGGAPPMVVPRETAAGSTGACVQ